MPSSLLTSAANVLLLFKAVINSCATPVAGPYIIIPDRAEACPRSEMALDFPMDFKIVRDRNNTNYFFVAVDWASQFTFDDTKDALLTFASWGTRGGWKENAMIMKFKKLCTTIKTHLPKIWHEILVRMTSNVTETLQDCPFPPGGYSVRNLSSSVLQPKGIPMLFYGKWKIDVKVVDPADQRVLGCMRLYASVIPKIGQPVG
ncbi:hypothetical protein FOCC_FOCC012404 [Frankliniella occidentalis]|uniref:Uncharacterized protein LOC113212428 isoform X1 n=1 Tax=Frankliniella occidentalis TaxID=133901 RepID=A0A9C6XQY1_FRAOC|nr:uncharacterized protein LOC113212428 isoform X1 [Frankliniella occidentalis]KAE8742077.1 hypothetical protein FOCC_FOCC012404 [Frankliniella occidentalis]